MLTKTKSKILSVSFDLQSYSINKEVIEIEPNGNNYRKLIGCNIFDRVDYNEDISIIVDDEGLFKSGNPVLQVTTEYGYNLKLAGKILFLKNHYTIHDYEFTGFNSGELLNLMMNLQIKPIYIVR